MTTAIATERRHLRRIHPIATIATRIKAPICIASIMSLHPSQKAPLNTIMLNTSVLPKPALLNWSNQGPIPSVQNQYAPAAKAANASVQTQDGILRP